MNNQENRLKGLLDDINELEQTWNQDMGAKKEVEKKILSLDKEIDSIVELIELNKQTSLFLQKVSEEVRQDIKTRLEDAVTSAIQFVSQKPYKFEIDITESRGKPSADFYVVEEINNEESRQKPEESCGGGFVDIIATSLRYAYLDLFSNPEIKGPILFDEPGKMIDMESSFSFAEFVKKLGQRFNKQTIMITHNDTLKNVADNSITVEKHNGVSKVMSG